MKGRYYRPPQVNENLMCRRKKRYPTKAKAQAANLGHRPYECPYCKQWHLTSKPERK